MKRRLSTTALLLVTTCLTAPNLARGADAEPSTPGASPAQGVSSAHENILEEVIVTSARKRNENVQTTPIAVTAINADILDRAHVVNFQQIGDLAPNLQIERNLGTGGTVNVYLRGFGDFSNDPAVDPRVAVFIDGIYQPSTSGDQFDLFDIASIEVQAGPQGTLLGKNAPVGAIYITTPRPTGKLGGEVEADYGSYDHAGLRGNLNFPILTDASGTSILAGRVSLSENEGGNWVYNIANGKRDMGGVNEKTGRLSLAFTPDPSFEWYVSASLSHDSEPQNGNQPADYTTVPGRPGTSSSATQVEDYACLFGLPVCRLRLPYGTTDSNFTNRGRDDQVQASSSMSYHFTPVTVTSVTGLATYWLADSTDDGGDPISQLNSISNLTRWDEETEELRISSNKGGGWDMDGRLDWVVGGYYSNFAYTVTNALDLGVLNGFTGPIDVPNDTAREDGTTRSIAAFLHAIYHFTDEWSGTFGVRQSWDHKTHDDQPFSGILYGGPTYYDPPAAWHNLSFEVGTAYQFDPYRMAYVRFAQGYESGGFDGFANSLQTGASDTFNPELNNEYEIGFKTDWLDRRLRVNIDFFINELSNLQVESALQVPPPQYFLQETLNAGSATVEGWEAQILALPIEDLTTRLNIGYLHTKYNQNFSTICANATPAGVLAPTDCSGIPFAESPKWTINLGADYVHDLPNDWGTATFSADWIYKSSLYTGDPVYPSSRQQGYGLVNLAMKLADPTDRYAVEVYGSNVLDRHYRVGYTDPSGLGAWEKDGRPAEWGIRLTYKFGDQ